MSSRRGSTVASASARSRSVWLRSTPPASWYARRRSRSASPARWRSRAAANVAPERTACRIRSAARRAAVASLIQHPFERRGGHRDFAPRHATGEVGGPARLDRQAHCVRHRDGIVRGGEGGVHQNSVHARSEEHTSELQSPCNLVCRLLLEKKKNTLKNGDALRHSSPTRRPVLSLSSTHCFPLHLTVKPLHTTRTVSGTRELARAAIWDL